MLHIIKDLNDQLLTLINDDPIRPEIPADQRVTDNGEIYVLRSAEGKPLAVTCVKFLETIPETVGQLTDITLNTTTAVFYSIWSYAAGSGRDLIVAAQASIMEHRPEITTFVTLSPKTEMARRFHLKNGAEVYRENSDSVNYRYK
jgi:hypothetical protein